MTVREILDVSRSDIRLYNPDESEPIFPDTVDTFENLDEVGDLEVESCEIDGWSTHILNVRLKDKFVYSIPQKAVCYQIAQIGSNWLKYDLSEVYDTYEEAVKAKKEGIKENLQNKFVIVKITRVIVDEEEENKKG